MTQIDTEWAPRVVAWQVTHGRNHLPWQNTRDPYRVWLSEIMLQQTQVVTVLDYYARFLDRFPDVSALAAASQDEVLGLWSGLGYYSRARNLHRCAQQVVAVHSGVFPKTTEQLQTLPGIGPSTAAAVASLCFGERAAILDGNVKRVLTRVLGFEHDLAVPANERALLSRAVQLLPVSDFYQSMARYTQGVMDLGATVCTPRQPFCERCPVQDLCVARKQGEPERYPVKTKKLKRTALSLWLLHAQDAEAGVWLLQRPIPGVWAGLYCLPLFQSRDALQAAVPPAWRDRLIDQPAFVHVLTHKDLYLHVVRLEVPFGQVLPLPLPGALIAKNDWPAMGLPAPVRKLLELWLDQPGLDHRPGPKKFKNLRNSPK
ncbi:MAG: A/G-specific adenine glycosylase [Pseudomonadota bacterium]|jgi:A/G-specific adenine glycosylase